MQSSASHLCRACAQLLIQNSLHKVVGGSAQVYEASSPQRGSAWLSASLPTRARRQPGTYPFACFRLSPICGSTCLRVCACIRVLQEACHPQQRVGARAGRPHAPTAAAAAEPAPRAVSCSERNLLLRLVLITGSWCGSLRFGYASSLGAGTGSVAATAAVRLHTRAAPLLVRLKTTCICYVIIAGAQHSRPPAHNWLSSHRRLLACGQPGTPAWARTPTLTRARVGSQARAARAMHVHCKGSPPITNPGPLAVRFTIQHSPALLICCAEVQVPLVEVR